MVRSHLAADAAEPSRPTGGGVHRAVRATRGFRLPATRRARLRAALAAGIALAASLATIPFAFAADDPFPAYAVFNVPAEDGTRDYAIENELVKLVDGVPAGSYIRGVMFSWSKPTVAEALARAAQRGVVVRVVLDETGAGVNTGADNEAMTTLRSAGLDDLVFCGGSGSVSGSTACIANQSDSINHNKFFTFSTSGTMKRVVFVATQNLTFTQNNLFNSALVVHEDYGLYDHFTAYFNDLRAQRKDNDYFGATNGYYKSPTTGVTVYHSPRASSDTVANRLAEVSASEAGCSVDVVHASLTDARPAVADQLLRIARLGCRVRVAYSSLGSAVATTLRRSANVELKKYEDNEDSNILDRTVSVHSKNIIIHGTFGGVAGRTVVFTGSHNLSGPSLRHHDETLVKIEHPSVSAAFQDNFETVWSRAKCVNPGNGSCLT